MFFYFPRNYIFVVLHDLTMLNVEIIDMLRVFTVYYELIEDTYRVGAYKNAITGVINLNYQLTTANIDDAIIQGVGRNIQGKILEFLKTGKVSELNKDKVRDKIKIFQIFLLVKGAGVKTAICWYKKGYRNISDVIMNEKTVTHTQYLGLKHYKDLLKKIPAEECRAIFSKTKKLFRENCGKLKNNCSPIFELLLVGSYRRGVKYPSYVDILCVAVNPLIIYQTFTNNLKNSKYFGGFFSTGIEKTSYLYWHNKIARQVDVIIVNPPQKIAALIYFTGSVRHNIVLRTLAARCGLKLTNNALINLTTGKVIPLESERDLYNKLGIPYVAPKKR